MPGIRILAIETATPMGSVALLEGADVVREIADYVPQRHLEWLAPAIARLLGEAEWRSEDVQALAVSLGPGSFTGLRIGIASAAAWAHARRLPIVGVSTLEVMAAATIAASATGGLICPVLDARRDEVAFGLFARRPPGVRLLSDMIVSVSRLIERLPEGEEITFTGGGVPRVLDAVRARPNSVIAPEAQWPPRATCVGTVALGRLAHGDRDDPYLLRPVYSRGVGVSPSPWTVLSKEGEGNSGTAGED